MMSNRRLIHEHYFVAKKVKGANHFIIRCITCGHCYCDICGKILGGFTDSSFFESESRSDNGVLDSKKLNKDIQI
jgi:hypothetical protein